MNDIQVEQYYKRQANDLTNMLYDKGFLNDAVSRESIDKLEEYIGYVIQSAAQSSAKVALLMEKNREGFTSLPKEKA